MTSPPLEPALMETASVPAPVRRTRSTGRARALLGMAVLTLVLWGVYAASPVRTSFDSRWTIHTALSFIQGDWGNLATFQPVLEQDSYFAVAVDGTRIMSIFPIGASVLSIPAVALADWFNPGFAEQIRYAVPVQFEGLLAAFYAALAGAVFFWAVWRRHGSVPVAVFTAALFCFATPMWSTASRALWQHGPQMLTFAIALALLTEARRRPHLIQYLGFVMAWAYVIRPTSSLEVLGATLYVAFAYRPFLLRYFLGAAVVAVPWIAYNIAFYQTVLPPYYWPQRLETIRFYEALAGHLISPARGLFIYSPVLLLAVPGMVVALRRREDRKLHVGMVIVIILHWIAVSRFRHWWGGFSYGPRLMSDVVPLLVWFIPFALPLKEHLAGAWRTAALATVWGLLAVSVWMNAQGAWNWRVYVWNATPENIDYSPERLWSWRDPPFLRGMELPDTGVFRHILSPRPEIMQPLPYRLGETATLAGNTSLLGRRHGWAATESWGVWTQGQRASLVLRLAEAAAGDLEMAVEGRIFTTPAHPRQEVEIRVNGTPVALWTAVEGTPASPVWHAHVPAAAVAGQQDIRIDFHIADPVSPAALGISSDIRLLGLGVSRLTLTPGS